jgi:hypothetical protein
MDNRPLWVIKVDTALKRVRDGYREAGEAIDDAMRSDPTLTQVLVAEALGKSTAWVSMLRKWHRDGCEPADGPFAAEIAARREKAKENEIQTSESELGQLWLFGEEHGGSSDYVPGQAEATLSALGLLAACRTLKAAVAKLGSNTLMLVFRSSADEKRRATLEKLAAELRQSLSAGNCALDEVRATLKKLPLDTNKAA